MKDFTIVGMFLITLTIAGDFDITQAKLGTIFCEIKRGQDIQNGKKLVAYLKLRNYFTKTTSPVYHD
jgi:hypothetical protein